MRAILARRLALRKALKTLPREFASIQEGQGYLNYCRSNKVAFESTVFKGTFYELAVMNFLQHSLSCNNLLKVGGANDMGIDIIGKWNLFTFWRQALENFPIQRCIDEAKNSNSLFKNAIELQEYFDGGDSQISLQKDVNIIVQCKNHKSKISVAIIRELVGTYMKQHKPPGKAFMVLASPGSLTEQSRRLMDMSEIPLIHCQFSSLTLDLDKDPYTLSSWSGGELKCIYLNPYTRDLVKGVYLESQIELLI